MSGKDVGYRRPPAEHRFKKGQSGNPSGRPKKKRPDILSQLDEPIAVKKDGQVIAMQPAEIMLQRLFKKAIEQKQTRSIIYLLDLLLKYDSLPTFDIGKNSGSIHLPTTMPFRMGSMALERFGHPDNWTEESLAAVREEYLATRSTADAQLDDVMGYFA